MKRNLAHGLSNGDVNMWMKVVRGRHVFSKISSRMELEAEMLELERAEPI